MRRRRGWVDGAFVLQQSIASNFLSMTRIGADYL
jgi:hypothetical protein